MSTEREQHRDALLSHFLEHTAQEDPALYERLIKVDEEGMRNLAGVLGRFDGASRAALEATSRLQACRILSRLHQPSTDSLATTNRILDYLDLNANSKLEESEIDLVVEVFELFARAESQNDTLSLRELQMLYASLRKLDRNSDLRLDAQERVELRRGLDDPQAFLANEKANNPWYRELLT
ncbi:MAG: hypothetical protein RBU37_06515 [Myxococcota bacterium]|jgi:hypothetical protein|nr:hypothetical protein [Myxococcota bacterium]